ncbi:UNVERIFIED_CONTAM: hypothetical protein FKN15_029452 [Acipenser sinensis]
MAGRSRVLGQDPRRRHTCQGTRCTADCPDKRLPEHSVRKHSASMLKHRQAL